MKNNEESIDRCWRMRGMTIAFGATIACMITGASQAGTPTANPEFKIYHPGNTGIPGQNNMMFVDFGPDGQVWTHARDFFQGVGGVAALNPAAGVWRTYSSLETPLDQWCYDMAFADDGSAWIASEDVVVHLDSDGETMTAYTPASTGVLTTDRYEVIDIDSNGHIWTANPGVVDLGGGLFEFDGSQWIKHEESWMETWTGFGVAPPLNVIARSNGDIIASFLSSPPCMGRYRNGQWTQITNWPLMIDMVEAPNGTLYGVSANGTWRLNDATDSWTQIGGFGASQIDLDPNTNAVYIRASSSTIVRKFNGVSWSVYAGFPGNTESMGVAPNGDVWITAEIWPSTMELHHFNAQGVLQRIYTRSNTGMLTYFSPWMFLDQQGMMWFHDSEYGASRLEPGENWRNFGIYNGSEETYPFWVSPVGMPFWMTPGYDFWTEGVEQIFQDAQGNFWFRGANIIGRSQGSDLSDWRIWEPGESGMPFSCTSIGQDADGAMWIGSEYSALRLEEDLWVEVPIGIEGQFAPVRGFAVAPDQSFWSARVGTFYRWQNGRFVPVFDVPGNIGEFQFAANGDLFFTTGDGLYRWNGTNLTHYTPANSGMAQSAAISIDIRASDGLVAVSTSDQSIPPYQGAVSLFDPATDEWTTYEYGSSFLPFYAPGQVQFDADGHLWIAMLNFGAIHVLIGEEPALLGDVDGNGIIDEDDRALFCAAIGSTAKDQGFIAAADLNSDDLIDQFDLALFNDILPACLGDVIDSVTFQPPGDGRVDGADLAYLIGAWGAQPSCADFVSSRTFLPPPDGVVDGADLAVLIGAWGPCPTN